MRRKAARWAADNFPKLADPDPKIPDVLNDRAADNWRPLLAIADLAGGDWPKRARKAACILSGEGHDTAVNVELLADIKAAFGEAEIMTSADLVAALVADSERPWGEWSRGKPLTQNQLARLLRPFAIISETVHPAGRPHAKGYKRVRFEDAWAVYSPGQNTSPHPEPHFKACGRASADETGTTRNFQSVQESDPHALKNDNLSYSHAGLHERTDEKEENGAEGDSATNGEVGSRITSDYDAVLEDLAARGEPAPIPDPDATSRICCDHCGRPADHQPLRIVGDGERMARLHRRCEIGWLNSGPGTPTGAPTSANGACQVWVRAVNPGRRQ